MLDHQSECGNFERFYRNTPALQSLSSGLGDPCVASRRRPVQKQPMPRRPVFSADYGIFKRIARESREGTQIEG